jgi:hypothetical protein
MKSYVFKNPFLIFFYLIEKTSLKYQAHFSDINQTYHVNIIKLFLVNLIDLDHRLNNKLNIYLFI